MGFRTTIGARMQIKRHCIGSQKGACCTHLGHNSVTLRKQMDNDQDHGKSPFGDFLPVIS